MSLLDEARKTINEVDKEMAILFQRRMQAAGMVAKHKISHGLPIEDKERELELIKRNSEFVEDDVIREYYVSFLEKTIEESKKYQSRIMQGMNVAYSGTEGAFAHIAAEKLFPFAKSLSFSDFENAYKAVEAGECDAAVLPLENSYNGEVGQVTDLAFSGSLYINGIFDLPVSHDLIGLPTATLEDVKEVISHPQALAQCSSFIKEHGLLQREFVNTALAVKHVKEIQNPNVAAIGSDESAKHFGLKVLAKNINASKSNTTRFAIFSRSERKFVESDSNIHTILFFTVRNEAGALAKAIEVIGNHGFNMRSLRSRPMKELLWQYYFYVEAEGNVHTPSGAEMIEELKQYCDKLRVVGSYKI